MESSTPADTGAPGAGEPADDPYEAFWRGLDEFLHALRRARGRSAAATPPGELTMSQLKLLEVIVGERTPTVGEIATFLEVAPPTATRMIDGLERAGLIERHDSDEDRRVVRIELTAEGRAARKRARGRLETRRRRLYDSLDETDRVQAARLLERIAAGMDAL